ncbi:MULTISPECIES: hypothetical protein [Escherichia]|uniref:hypothetical protein n=1 Tax=Escherichia TaxID=561 RepID=UPI0007E2F6A4|nr:MULTISPECIES: hypothetical protein [Escherichia]MEB7938948.1 hypothetical protein [Escherichia whittamii]MEC9493531.1 hypothetical protein [Escherichia whittamii]MEC9558016.1 hypothetical protein [Escherichia whittamii]QLX44282.1 hypothetical protein HV146_09495 [Escherichia coli]
MPTLLKLTDKQLRQISASVLESVKAKSIVTSPSGEVLRKNVDSSAESTITTSNIKAGTTVITGKQATRIFDNAFKKVVSTK